MYKVARLKLVGGEAKTKYDPWNQNHIFAVTDHGYSSPIAITVAR